MSDNSSLSRHPTPNQELNPLEMLALLMGFARHATEWYAGRENYYYQSFKAAKPLESKSSESALGLPPTRAHLEPQHSTGHEAMFLDEDWEG